MNTDNCCCSCHPEQSEGSGFFAADGEPKCLASLGMTKRWFSGSDSPDRLESAFMLVLASASPRRQELLRNAGIAFVARPTDILEKPKQGEPPRAFAERMAREKA